MGLSRLFRVDFALGRVVFELFGATDLLGGAEFEFLLNLGVVEAFFIWNAREGFCLWVGGV